MGTPATPQKPEQIAYYDDGVGTSSFKPLAVLGGAFGWGLKRNVLDLYTFLCRNYRPGDRIYGFGFSRGAFTMRVLAGLLNHQGLVRVLSQSCDFEAKCKTRVEKINDLRVSTFLFSVICDRTA